MIETQEVTSTDEFERIVYELRSGNLTTAFVRDDDHASVLRCQLRNRGIDTAMLITFLERRSVAR